MGQDPERRLHATETAITGSYIMTSMTDKDSEKEEALRLEQKAS